MQMLAEEILSPLSVKQDRRIAGLTPISSSETTALELQLQLHNCNLPQIFLWKRSLLAIESAKLTVGDVEE
jgi:hypothetical protein